MDFHAFSQQMARNATRNQKWHEILQGQTLPADVSVGERLDGHFNFQVHLNAEYSLSCSHPPDRDSNMIETALFRKGEFVRDYKLGYEDVNGFESVPALLAEIQRLASTLK